MIRSVIFDFNGVLIDWFRRPQHHYGTTYRIINLIALLQIATIALSRGDVYLLGEAYAFGVVWSFFLKSLGVLVLRYHRHDQEYKFPLNLQIAGKEIPVGLAATTLVLFLVAIANLFSKQIATIYGVSFTAVFFVIFTISERLSHKREKKGLEQFNLDMRPEIETGTGAIHARPGCILVAVRNPHRLQHLARILAKLDTRKQDIVVLSVRHVTQAASGRLR